MTPDAEAAALVKRIDKWRKDWNAGGQLAVILDEARRILAAREAGPGREWSQLVWNEVALLQSLASQVDTLAESHTLAERPSFAANISADLRDMANRFVESSLDAAPKSAEPVPSSEAIAAARSDWLIPREYLPDERK